MGAGEKKIASVTPSMKTTTNNFQGSLFLKYNFLSIRRLCLLFTMHFSTLHLKQSYIVTKSASHEVLKGLARSIHSVIVPIQLVKQLVPFCLLESLCFLSTQWHKQSYLYQQISAQDRKTFHPRLTPWFLGQLSEKVLEIYDNEHRMQLWWLHSDSFSSHSSFHLRSKS